METGLRRKVFTEQGWYAPCEKIKSKPDEAPKRAVLTLKGKRERNP